MSLKLVPFARHADALSPMVAWRTAMKPKHLIKDEASGLFACSPGGGHVTQQLAPISQQTIGGQHGRAFLVMPHVVLNEILCRTLEQFISPKPHPFRPALPLKVTRG